MSQSRLGLLKCNQCNNFGYYFVKIDGRQIQTKCQRCESIICFLEQEAPELLGLKDEATD